MSLSKRKFAPYLPSVEKTEEDGETVKKVGKVIEETLSCKITQDTYARCRGAIDVDTKLWRLSEIAMLELVALCAQEGWFVYFSKKSFETFHAHLS